MKDSIKLQLQWWWYSSTCVAVPWLAVLKEFVLCLLIYSLSFCPLLNQILNSLVDITLGKSIVLKMLHDKRYIKLTVEITKNNLQNAMKTNCEQ